MGSERSLRTVVVDDHPAFLEVAREVIAAAPGFEPAGEFSSPAAALEGLDAAAPDLAIVDVHMPEMDGGELTRRIKARRPEVAVVLVSAQDPGELSRAARESGACDAVRKQEFGRTLLERIRREHILSTDRDA